ncbi:MAG TPA: alpha/beta hydrolase [Polyangiaceae bacterium]|nr:alpha/beta hydrolase [Polyangiaceae bacterium]
MKTGRAKSGNVEIAYSVEGDGPETVLLVMGLGGRAADWGTAFPSELARRYRVVRMDNRGVGASPRAEGGYELSDLARDTTAVLDALGTEKAHYCGVSMGGMISQLAALEHAPRIDKLVLLSTHFGGHGVVPPTPLAMRLFDPGEFLSRGRDPVAMMQFTISVITAPGFAEKHPEVVTTLLENVRREPTDPRAFLAQVQAIIGSDRSEKVQGIRAKTLVVHGTEDQLIPVGNGKALAERIPGSKLVLFEDCGHMPMWEKPAELAREVLSFLG